MSQYITSKICQAGEIGIHENLFAQQEFELVCSTEMIYGRINAQGKSVAIDPQLKKQISVG